MTTTKLSRRDIAPDTEAFQALFTQPDLATESDPLMGELQPRLHYALEQLFYPQSIADLLLVKAPEEPDYLKLLAETAEKLHRSGTSLCGVNYVTNGECIQMFPAQKDSDNFASRGPVLQVDWVEPEQLFGCVRQFNGKVTLEPGLVHKANGGVLILSLRALLAQPLMLMRMKNILTRGRFDWLSWDESRPLPVSVPPMPLTLKLILVGDRDALADFQEMEPDLAESALYSEYEDHLQVVDEDALRLWCQWVWQAARSLSLPGPDADAWQPLIQEAARYTGDQQTFPLSPLWVARQLREAAAFCEGERFSAEQLSTMLAQRQWREGYLAERMQDEILLDQILIETEGEQIGQINALSVIEFPGHPRAFGEPSRISCVIHFGDGEFMDIERKADLGGNIHAKGMMIMQAFLMAELGLDQQLPFSASLTFEQSYSEVDGDSASMAELCVLVSALAQVPVNQSIAITGSVDQFGRTQPVGGLNEKIEGFFTICQQRGLTGQQGVIIPAANVRHLSLSQEVQQAVEAGEFSLWAIDDVADALRLLTGLAWDGEGQTTLLQTIQERIAQANQQEDRHRPWALRWLNAFGSN